MIRLYSRIIYAVSGTYYVHFASAHTHGHIRMLTSYKYKVHTVVGRSVPFSQQQYDFEKRELIHLLKKKKTEIKHLFVF